MSYPDSIDAKMEVPEGFIAGERMIPTTRSVDGRDEPIYYDMTTVLTGPFKSAWLLPPAGKQPAMIILTDPVTKATHRIMVKTW